MENDEGEGGGGIKMKEISMKNTGGEGGIQIGLPNGQKKTIKISIFIEDLSRNSVIFREFQGTNKRSKLLSYSWIVAAKYLHHTGAVLRVVCCDCDSPSHHHLHEEPHSSCY